jgi:excisionase family DNA binding protein
MDQHLSIKQAADRLGVSVNTLYKIIRDGGLPYVALTPDKRVIAESDLQAFLASRRTTGPSPRRRGRRQLETAALR